MTRRNPYPYSTHHQRTTHNLPAAATKIIFFRGKPRSLVVVGTNRKGAVRNKQRAENEYTCILHVRTHVHPSFLQTCRVSGIQINERRASRIEISYVPFYRTSPSKSIFKYLRCSVCCPFSGMDRSWSCGDREPYHMYRIFYTMHACC